MVNKGSFFNFINCLYNDSVHTFPKRPFKFNFLCNTGDSSATGNFVLKKHTWHLLGITKKLTCRWKWRNSTFQSNESTYWPSGMLFNNKLLSLVKKQELGGTSRLFLLWSCKLIALWNMPCKFSFVVKRLSRRYALLKFLKKKTCSVFEKRCLFTVF